MRVLGVDGCKQGWVGVVLRPRAMPIAVFGHDIAAVVSAAGAVDAVAIDIPIHPPDIGVRACDLAVKAFLGPQAPALFMTPVRSALLAASYIEANIASRTEGNGGISQQAWALRSKVLEVDAWLPQAPCSVYEVHPETSFFVIAGERLPGKKTWAGHVARRDLLTEHRIVLPDDLGEAGRRAAPDDVLDAAAAAWSGLRAAQGKATRFPEHGREPGVIWV